jgi:hypothetical protein
MSKTRFAPLAGISREANMALVFARHLSTF